MLRHLINFRRLHLHLIAEHITIQLKPARGCDHARVVGDRLARKMDAKHEIH